MLHEDETADVPDILAVCHLFKVNLIIHCKDGEKFFQESLNYGKDAITIHITNNDSINHFDSVRREDDPCMGPIFEYPISLDSDYFHTATEYAGAY